jgi:hypothetical protein
MSRTRLRWSMALCGLLAGAAGGVHAKDAFVVISGGGGPDSNHYSQYLQARAYATYLRAHYPQESIWTFFGAGNVSGQPPALFDVEQTTTDDAGHETTVWIAGALPDNRPARHDAIARAFHDEILPAVKDGGTLYLFVGDHGGPSVGANPESVISLWGWDRDPTAPFGWRSYDDSLGVAELRRWLSAGLGQGRVVFVMSQCFSGGFHYLGSPRDVAVNPAWFSRAPRWVGATEETRNMPPAAGFSATDDHSFASGCTSDVSADHWAGYERYLPETLLGLDLFTLQKGKQPALHSFHDAHVRAAQVDQTIDKPRSTSEQYLAVWAEAITRTAKEPNLADSVKKPLDDFRKTMDGKEPRVADAAFTAREDEYRRLADGMIKANPKLADLLAANGGELERAIRFDPDAAAANQAEQGASADDPTSANDRDDDSEDMQLAAWLWAKDIAPAWQKAVDADEVTDLAAPVLAFERDMAAIEVRKRSAEARSTPARGIGDPRLLVYYHGGYADPATFDATRAKAIADWARKRKHAIVEWAKKSKDAKLRAAAEAYALWVPSEVLDPDASDGVAASDARRDGGSGGVRNAGQREKGADEQKHPPLKRSVAAARIYFHRQVLAAWQFLLSVQERPALERVTSLTQLEHTALPGAAEGR